MYREWYELDAVGLKMNRESENMIKIVQVRGDGELDGRKEWGGKT